MHLVSDLGTVFIFYFVACVRLFKNTLLTPSTSSRGSQLVVALNNMQSTECEQITAGECLPWCVLPGVVVLDFVVNLFWF